VLRLFSLDPVTVTVSCTLTVVCQIMVHAVLTCNHLNLWLNFDILSNIVPRTISYTENLFQISI
jgi:hypothetical protein